MSDRAPDIEWKPEELLVHVSGDCAMWLPLVRFPTKTAAERFAADFQKEETWRVHGREYLAPIQEGDWEQEAWWVKADRDAEYAVEFWRLLDTAAEEYYDTRFWRLNPLYEGERSDPASLQAYGPGGTEAPDESEPRGAS